MPQIPHKYVDKLRREIQAYDEWLANTQPQADGSIHTTDLETSFRKANAIYIKALELYRISQSDDKKQDPDDLTEAEIVINHE